MDESFTLCRALTLALVAVLHSLLNPKVLCFLETDLLWGIVLFAMLMRASVKSSVGLRLLMRHPRPSSVEALLEKVGQSALDSFQVEFEVEVLVSGALITIGK